MKIKVKLLNDTAIVPTKAHASDAGYDLYVNNTQFDAVGNIVYGSGVAMEIPKGYVGLVFPRSSIASKSLSLSNSVGVIDSGYRGEIMGKFRDVPTAPCNVYEVGERFAQIIIMPYPEVEFEVAESLDDSDRGEGGYGSSGN